jgi:nucleoside transporter
VIGYVLKIEDSHLQFKVAAMASFVMAAYCLTLPHTPPKSRGSRVRVRDVLGLDALALLKHRDFAVFLACSFLLCIPVNFYFVLANAYFNESGLPFPATKMALGQVSDLVFLSLLPFFLRRLGIKRVFMIGIAGWAVRYVLLAYGNSGPLVWMFYAAILIHGMCYSFFYVAAQIYTDSQAHDQIRAAAQGLITLVNLGLGNYVGVRLAGETLDYFTARTPTGGAWHNWWIVWLIPAAGAAIVLLITAFLFRGDRQEPQPG